MSTALPTRTPGQTPEDELGQWRDWRKQIEAGGPQALDAWASAASPEERAYFNGPSPRPKDPRFNEMYAPQAFSPEAGNTYVNDQTHYDIPSGEVQKNKGVWDLPETYAILAMAAGMGGVVAGPAIAGAVSGHTGAGTAAAATGGKVGTLGSILNYAKQGKDAYDTYSGLTDVLGKAAGSSTAEEQHNDQLKMLLENSKLNRDKFALMAPGQRLKTSEVANMLSSYTPSKMDWGPGGFTPGAGARGVQPTITGGVSASIAHPSASTAALRQQVMDQQLINQMKGDAGTDLSGVGSTSVGNQILGGAATGTGILEALAKLWKPRTTGVTDSIQD